MVTKINIISKKKLKNPVLLVGLPGIGLVGKIAIDYLLNELKPKPEKYAEIYSDTFPPAVHTKNSIMELIRDEIYVYSTKKRDVLLLVGPVQPVLSNLLNNAEHYEFSETIASFANKSGVKEIYTFAGLNIGDKRISNKPKVIGVCTDKKTREVLEKKKITNLFFDDTNKDTLISGVAGLLPSIANSLYNISGVCVMGETNSQLTYGDPSSAKEVLEIILKLFELTIDLKAITENSKKIEESFSNITKNLEKMNTKEAINHSSYIR
jgi:hypothetical protein